MEARGASGKRYLQPKGKECSLGAANLGLVVQGGGSVILPIDLMFESFFIVINETWLSHPEDVARKVSSDGSTDLQ